MNGTASAWSGSHVAQTLDYSGPRRPSVALIVVVALLLTAAAWGGYFIYQIPKNAAKPPAPPDYHFFHGRVIDQDGNPVVQAEVKPVASELAANTLIAGSYGPNHATQNKFSVWSDRNGYFMVTIRGSYQHLLIHDIVKPGYEWVFDWAPIESQGSNPYLSSQGNNRFYQFTGPHGVGTPHQPDPDNRAIFPMHEIGNPAPATRPSRGGKDGRRVNGPTDLVVPSAGPGAPRTNAEIGEAIRAASERQRQKILDAEEERRSRGYGLPGD